MISRDLRTAMLHNMDENLYQMLEAKNVHPLLPTDIAISRVNVVGAGPSLFQELRDFKGITLANQSSAPYLALHNILFSHVVLVDPQEVVRTKIQFLLESPNTYCWFVSSFIHPTVMKALIDRGDPIYVFKHILHEDKEFNLDMEDMLPDWKEQPVSLAQMGSVVNASIGLASICYPNCSEIYITGVDFCWTPGGQQRIHDVVKVGPHSWAEVARTEFGPTARVFGKDTTPSLLSYMEQFSMLRQCIKQPLVAGPYLSALHGLEVAT